MAEWSKRSNQEKATPRPRPVCVVHTGSPAVLAGSRPLRNSRIHALGHARFPLDPPPLLGAPEGPRVPSTRLPAWFLRCGRSAGLRVLSGKGQSQQRSQSEAEARRAELAPLRATEPSKLGSTQSQTSAPVAELAPLLSLRSRFLSSKSIRKVASKTRQEAGSKENGAPRERRGAERSAGESEHVRAHGCASCAAACAS